MPRIAPFVFLAVLATIISMTSALGAETKNVKLVVQDFPVCGGAYSSVTVVPENPMNVVTYSEARVQIGQQTFMVTVPKAIVLSDSLGTAKSATMNTTGQTSLVTTKQLLPFLPPTTSDKRTLEAFCQKVKVFHDALKRNNRSISISGGNFLKITLTPNGRASVNMLKTFTASMPALPSIDSFKMKRTTPPGSIEHLIFYTPEYATEAETLRSYRASKGMNSVAIDVTKIPGMNEQDPMPASCTGYEEECYYFFNKTIDGIAPDAAEGLFGMGKVHIFPKGINRVPDYAGLTRAYLRKMKTDNPHLKYVILIGDYRLLATRFTDRKTIHNTGRGFTVPTDIYFSEVFTPWAPTGQVNYTTNYDLIWPNGQINVTTNSDWDTRHFGWSVRYPFARTFTPPTGAISDDNKARIIAVGRLIGKAKKSGEPFPGFAMEGYQDDPVPNEKDPSIAAYIEKLKKWEENPRGAGETTVSITDGVYSRDELATLKGSIGKFGKFYGEGFGTGYITAQNKPNDFDPATCYQPASDSWEEPNMAPPFSGTWYMYGYQYQHANCKPRHPTLADLRLPYAGEVADDVSAHGYDLFYQSGHGGPLGMGFNTNGEWEPGGQCYIAYHVRKFTEQGWVSTSTMPVYYPLSNFKHPAGRPNGFWFSCACSVTHYLGGDAEIFWRMRYHKTYGEVAAMLSDGGAVGISMNYVEGWYGGDPAYENVFASAIKTVRNYNGNAKIGDAMILNNQHHFSSSYIDHQPLNRIFLGDPAARLAKDGGIIHDDNDLSMEKNHE